MATIELGEWRGDYSEVRAAPSPRFAAKGAIAVILVVCCLALFTGAVQAAPGLGAPLWTNSVSLTGFSLGSHSVYLAEPGGGAILGLGLETGEQSWRLPTADLLSFVVDAGPGMALVITHRRSDGGQNNVTDAIALVDKTNGRVLARAAGSPLTLGGSTLLVMLGNGVVGIDGCAVQNPPCTVLSAMDRTTGAPVWRRALRPGQNIVYDVGGLEALTVADQVVVVGADGRVDVWDITTGATVESVQLPTRVDLAGNPGWWVMVRGVIVNAVQEQDRVLLQGFLLAPFRPIWTLELPLEQPEAALQGWVSIMPCGDVTICVNSAAGTTVVDQNVGVVTTRIEGTEVVARLGGGALVTTPLSSINADQPQPTILTVFDPSGQRVLSTLTGWDGVDWRDSAGRGMVSRQGTERTEFAIIDANAHISPLGSLPYTDLICRAQGGILVCSDRAGNLRAWRLPR